MEITVSYFLFYLLVEMEMKRIVSVWFFKEVDQ